MAGFAVLAGGAGRETNKRNKLHKRRFKNNYGEPLPELSVELLSFKPLRGFGRVTTLGPEADWGTTPAVTGAGLLNGLLTSGPEKKIELYFESNQKKIILDIIACRWRKIKMVE